MSAGDFGTPVQFFWELHPALVGFIVFAIDFGAIMVIRGFVERRIYFLRWWSFKVGDTIALPVYAGFASLVISDGDLSGFYTHWVWHVSVLVIGYFIFVSLHVNSYRTGFFSRQDAINPSELYHTGIAVVMFYLMVTVLPPVLASDSLAWLVFFAALGLATYAFAWFIDQTSLVDKTPGRILQGELVIDLSRKE